MFRYLIEYEYIKCSNIRVQNTIKFLIFPNNNCSFLVALLPNRLNFVYLCKFCYETNRISTTKGNPRLPKTKVGSCESSALFYDFCVVVH